METFPTGSGVPSQGCAMPEAQNAQSVEALLMLELKPAA